MFTRKDMKQINAAVTEMQAGFKRFQLFKADAYGKFIKGLTEADTEKEALTLCKKLGKKLKGEDCIIILDTKKTELAYYNDGDKALQFYDDDEGHYKGYIKKLK